MKSPRMEPVRQFMHPVTWQIEETRETVTIFHILSRHHKCGQSNNKHSSQRSNIWKESHYICPPISFNPSHIMKLCTVNVCVTRSTTHPKCNHKESTKDHWWKACSTLVLHKADIFPVNWV